MHLRSARRTGLLLIDPQKGFTQGQWAASYVDGDTAPIGAAFEAVKRLHDRGGLRDVPILVTLTPFLTAPACDRELHPAFMPWLSADEPSLRNVTTLLKPSEDIMADRGNASVVAAWLEQWNVARLVLAGCTTTACVRRSSQSLHRHFIERVLDNESISDRSQSSSSSSGYGISGGERERKSAPEQQPQGDWRLQEVVVDLSLCGARRAKVVPVERQDEEGVPVSVSLDGAVAEMRRGGVTVADEWAGWG